MKNTYYLTIEHGCPTASAWTWNPDSSLCIFFSVGEVIDEADLNEVLDVLESLDDTMATEQQVEFVRCSEAKMLDRYGLSMLPSIVYFDSGVPVVYQSGDLKNKDAILGRSIIFLFSK